MCKYYLWKATAPYNYTGIRSSYKAGIILINDQNEVLLVKNYEGKWSFPKGSVELDENVKEAAMRELREETGISIAEDQLKLTFRYYRQQYFVARFTKDYDINLIQNKNEITGIGWFCFNHGSLNVQITKPTFKLLALIEKDIKEQ